MQSRNPSMTSLEGVLVLSSPRPSLTSEQRQRATRIFITVIEAGKPLQDHMPYKQATLDRLAYALRDVKA